MAMAVDRARAAVQRRAGRVAGVQDQRVGAAVNQVRYRLRGLLPTWALLALSGPGMRVSDGERLSAEEERKLATAAFMLHNHAATETVAAVDRAVAAKARETL